MSSMSARSTSMDTDALAQLTRVVTGDAQAWQAMQAAIAAQLFGWVRSHPGMRRRGLSGSVDDVHDVVTSTFERLRAHDFANLARFLARHHAPRAADLEAWLYGAVDYAVREHLRARFGRTAPLRAQAEAHAQPSKRDFNTLAARLSDEDALFARSGLTWEVTMREVMAHVRAHFSALEARAMELYLQQGDDGYAELALSLGLDTADEAERLIRKLKERLRVRYRSLG